MPTMSSTPRPWPGTQIMTAAGRRAFVRKQEIREHADAGAAVEDDLLARVSWKRPCLERDRHEAAFELVESRR